MLFLERSARVLLLLHLVGAGALVALTTHQLAWCRGYLRGDFARARAERWFALASALVFVGDFALGGLMYPTYKIRVRAQYLDAPASVAAEVAERADEAAKVGAPPPSRRELGELSWVGRLFDVKEHWAALGCAASLLLLALARFAHPSGDRRTLLLYLGLSAFACAAAWAGAIIGAVTSSFRSVGGV